MDMRRVYKRKGSDSRKERRRRNVAKINGGLCGGRWRNVEG